MRKTPGKDGQSSGNLRQKAFIFAVSALGGAFYHESEKQRGGPHGKHLPAGRQGPDRKGDPLRSSACARNVRLQSGADHDHRRSRAACPSAGTARNAPAKCDVCRGNRDHDPALPPLEDRGQTPDRHGCELHLRDNSKQYRGKLRLSEHDRRRARGRDLRGQSRPARPLLEALHRSDRLRDRRDRDRLLPLHRGGPFLRRRLQ